MKFKPFVNDMKFHV